MSDEITFSSLRNVNVIRCESVFHPVDDWSPAEWAVAMAGECGEVCNAVKKLRRIADGTNTAKDPQTKDEAIEQIADELADLIIYADLLAARLDIDLTSAVRRKFNQVSELRNASERI